MFSANFANFLKNTFFCRTPLGDCFWISLCNSDVVQLAGLRDKAQIMHLNLAPKKCFRSSPPEVLCKKGVLRNFAKFRRKHLCHILLKLQAWGLQIYWKWDSGTCALLWIFLEFLRKSFSIEHLRWLLLEFKTRGDINSAIHRTSI